MVKAMRVSLVLTLWMPRTVAAQPALVQVTGTSTIRLLRSFPPPALDHGAFAPKPMGMPAAARTAQTSSRAQPPQERSWAGRHPAALGAMIGAAAGAILGSSGCWKSPCGDGHGPLLVAFGAGLGAGIGAGVGFSVSLARR